jgi:hypothetical protein
VEHDGLQESLVQSHFHADAGKGLLSSLRLGSASMNFPKLSPMAWRVSPSQKIDGKWVRRSHTGAEAIYAVGLKSSIQWLRYNVMFQLNFFEFFLVYCVVNVSNSWCCKGLWGVV